MTISSRVLALLIRCPTVNKVKLSSNQFGGSRYLLNKSSASSDAFSHIVDAMVHGNLTEVDLSQNGLMPDCCQPLLHLLQHGKVKTLNLSHNNLGASGISALSSCIGLVSHLDLSYNYLFAKGGLLLCEVGSRIQDFTALQASYFIVD